jgi:hypothetical protein
MTKTTSQVPLPQLRASVATGRAGSSPTNPPSPLRANKMSPSRNPPFCARAAPAPPFRRGGSTWLRDHPCLPPRRFRSETSWSARFSRALWPWGADHRRIRCSSFPPSSLLFLTSSEASSLLLFSPNGAHSCVRSSRPAVAQPLFFYSFSCSSLGPGVSARCLGCTLATAPPAPHFAR